MKSYAVQEGRYGGPSQAMRTALLDTVWTKRWRMKRLMKGEQPANARQHRHL